MFFFLVITTDRQISPKDAFSNLRFSSLLILIIFCIKKLFIQKELYGLLYEGLRIVAGSKHAKVNSHSKQGKKSKGPPAQLANTCCSYIWFKKK